MKSERIYYFIAFTNLCFRFAWSLTLMPEVLFSDNTVSSTLLAHVEPVVASIEIVRRMLWAILRVEWEHIETGGAVLDISVDQDSYSLDMDKVLTAFLNLCCFNVLMQMNIMTFPTAQKPFSFSAWSEDDWTTSSYPAVEAFVFAGTLVSLIALMISLLNP